MQTKPNHLLQPITIVGLLLASFTSPLTSAAQQSTSSAFAVVTESPLLPLSKTLLSTDEHSIKIAQPVPEPISIRLSKVLLSAPEDADKTVPIKSSSHSITPTPTAIRVSYESLKLPGGEKMGMLAGNLLFDVNDNLRLGVGSYGSIEGQRGGFITLGVEAEVQKRISQSWISHAGLFVGGGGGRGGNELSGLSGGGLMLRGDIGVTYQSIGYGNFGVGVSHVNFPSGVIASTQPYIQYEYPFHSLLAQGWESISPNIDNLRLDPVQAGANEFSLVARNYLIPSSVVRDGGKPQSNSMQLIGVEWLTYLDDRWFLKLETEGAMGGENNGYMQILAGTGYRLPLSQSTSIKIHAVAGPAGGGGADTGGGLLLDAGLSLQQNLTKRTALEISIGEVRAPSRSFEALSLGMKLNYQFGLPNVSAPEVSWAALGEFDANPMRIRVANQTYFKADSLWRNHSIDSSVSNIGLQLDYFISPHYFLTGQAIAAYAGNAGAFMTGQVGIGTQWPLTDHWFIEGECLIGAAGGGGLAISGGLVAQANVSAGYQLSKGLSLMATAGRIEAVSGDFKANVAGLSLAYQFTGFTGQ